MRERGSNRGTEREKEKKGSRVKRVFSRFEGTFSEKCHGIFFFLFLLKTKQKQTVKFIHTYT
jgi:hypothetical protein